MRMIFDEDSPFTGNRRVLIEPDPEKQDHMKICMDTGYHTYTDRWKTGTETIDLVEDSLPNMLIESKKETADGNTWYKVLFVTPYVILTPEVIDTGEVWAVYSLRDGNPDTDPILMEVDTVGGGRVYRTIDSESRVEFPSDKFEMAMDMFQSIGAAVYGAIFDSLGESEAGAI